MLNVLIDNKTDAQIENVQELLNNYLDLLQYGEDFELSLLFCENSFIHELNLKYREKDSPTDVLSFPAEMDFFLGDIVISLERAKEQAEDGLEKEVEMLLAHGLLHLLGYDHEVDESSYEEMMGLQKMLLQDKKKEIKVQWD